MAIFKLITAFALLLIAYGIIVMGGGGVVVLDAVAFDLKLVSGATLSLTKGDLFLVFGVLGLYVEVFKATRTGTASVIDHSISMLVFIVYLVMFLTVEACAHSVFVVLGLMAFLDVVAGFTITIAASRRDLAIGN